MAGFETISVLITGFIESLKVFLIYGLPLIAMAAVLGGITLYIRKQKIYSIEAVIDVVTSNNLVRCYDKGGIVKNLLGVEEFRFKKRKKSCPVPDRKYWILKDNGRFCIHFYRYSDDDFDPVNISVNNTGKKGIGSIFPIPSFKAVKNVLNPSSDTSFIPDPKMKPADLKDEYSKISYTPIKSEAKQFMVMKNKEITLKNKRKSEREKWLPFLIYGGVIVLLIFTVFMHVQYAEKIADKQFDCIKPEMVKEVMKNIDSGIEESKAERQSPDGLQVLNPFK